MKFGRILIVALLLTTPAFASEDGEIYDESIDYNTSDTNTDVPLDIANTAISDSNGTTEELSDKKNNNNNDGDKIFIPERPAIKTDNNIEKGEQPQYNLETPKTSLTEQLQNDPKNKNESIIDGTWIEKLTELSPGKLLEKDNEDDKAKAEKSNNDETDTTSENEADIDDMMNISRKKGKMNRSNAAVFDIAGVMLRMNVEQTSDVLTNRGFKKINARYQVPNFIKWRNEEICRNSGIVGYERIQACMMKKAKKDGFEYIEYLKFAKFETKEEIEIYFTSNFTGNKVYKIYYTSNIVSINGNSPKAVYLRNLKVYDFWRKISRKYGSPDDKSMVTWGLGGNKPYLKAKTGKLKLEDPVFVELDYNKMAQEDQRFVHSDFYNF